ncbi:hypothetical protein RRG08_049614 [Elysia crispata]|uniref:Uncharacterized protein n=1 Tax=Elysia crispata TaxID=231223 RepID=A0AAE1AUC7_9GAST|nr:hypothetical protein RRG08_049614 [Elysia crispata]
MAKLERFPSYAFSRSPFQSPTAHSQTHRRTLFSSRLDLMACPQERGSRAAINLFPILAHDKTSKTTKNRKRKYSRQATASELGTICFLTSRVRHKAERWGTSSLYSLAPILSLTALVLGSFTKPRPSPHTVPEPSHGTPALTRYPSPHTVPQPSHGTPALIRYPSPHTVPQPSYGTPALIRYPSPHTVPQPSHGTPALIRYPSPHTVPQPPHGTPAVTRYPSPHTVPQPSHGTPALIRYPSPHTVPQPSHGTPGPASSRPRAWRAGETGQPAASTTEGRWQQEDIEEGHDESREEKYRRKMRTEKEFWKNVAGLRARRGNGLSQRTSHSLESHFEAVAKVTISSSFSADPRRRSFTFIVDDRAVRLWDQRSLSVEKAGEREGGGDRGDEMRYKRNKKKEEEEEEIEGMR